MNRTERAEHLEGTITNALKDLETAMRDGKSEDFAKALTWWSKFRTYSFNNSLLILLQQPDAIQVAGFRRWEALGYHVRKGEKCIYIRGPVFRKQPDPDSGEIVERLVSYIPLCVFDIQQCVEWPEKQPPEPYQPETSADWEYLYEVWCRRLTTLYQIRVQELNMGALTYGMATDSSIRLNAQKDLSVRAMTLIHETCHIAAKHTSERGKWTYQEREAQVEASAFVLCQALGVVHPNAANYLLHYKVEEGQLREHLDTISQIVRDVRHMLGFDTLGKPVAKAA